MAARKGVPLDARRRCALPRAPRRRVYLSGGVPLSLSCLCIANYSRGMTDLTPGWDPKLATRQNQCERCGTTFGCRDKGAEGECWCSREAFKLPVPLPEGVGPYGDCLCPACLREVADELRHLKPAE